MSKLISSIVLRQPGREIFSYRIGDIVILCEPIPIGAAKAPEVNKEIEGLQKVRNFRDLEEFAGSSVEIFPEDLVFSCLVNSVGAPYSVGIPNKGRDVTIIVHGEEKDEEKNEIT